MAPAGIRSIAVACATCAMLHFTNPYLGAATMDSTQPVGRGQQMVATLSARGPHASLGDQARIWDRFIGAWDCDFRFHLADGGVRHSRGEVVFGWVLDGRAVQDLWITYPEGEQERGMGTSIRFFDDAAKTWRVVFVSPKHNAVISVRGGVEGESIVLRGQDVDGGELRWSFNDLSEDSFTWRGEKSRDGGKTWKLEEEHRMTRRPSGKARAGG